MKTIINILIGLIFSISLFAQQDTLNINVSNPGSTSNLREVRRVINHNINELPTIYHPLGGLNTLNLVIDTAKLRGKLKHSTDTTLIYLPQPQTSAGFIGSVFFGNGGSKLSHASSIQGQYNTGVGLNSLYNLTSGNSNMALGAQSLILNTTGSGNTAIGRQALQSNLTGQNNTSVGFGSGNFTTGTNNTFIGARAGLNNTSGGSNVAIGANIGFNGGNYDSCVFIGFRAAIGVTNKGLSQKSQIKIGSQAGYSDTTNYTLYIDNSSTTNFQTPLIGGRFDLNRVSINKLMPACGDSTLNVGGGIDARSANFTGTSIKVNGLLIQTGSGSPENVVTAPIGSLFLRIDGGAGTSMYIKESGTGNIGWIAK